MRGAPYIHLEFGTSRLWEVELEGGNPREIAGYGLFDDPLNW
jgi:hypothetical protein